MWYRRRVKLKISCNCCCYMAAKIVCPGDRLGPKVSFEAGEGTFEYDGYICASLVGRKAVTHPQPGAVSQLPTVHVTREGTQPVVPQIGNVVLGKVLRVNARLATLEILCLGNLALEQNFSGVIRAQDVRQTEVDKVDMHTSFRPGDIVRAEVLSLGDWRSYQLTTAKNELGVVFAKSVAGVPMVSLSWTEMQCPETKTVEKRKVAKLLPAAS
eukprot:jgi/Botrbrau1/5995/Bobra.104_1s0025.1